MDTTRMPAHREISGVNRLIESGRQRGPALNGRVVVSGRAACPQAWKGAMMQDAYETPFDRYDTPFDGDKDTHRLDAALDRVDARLAEMDARLTRIEASLGRLEARLDRTTRFILWGHVLLTLEVAVGFGLVIWLR